MWIKHILLALVLVCFIQACKSKSITAGYQDCYPKYHYKRTIVNASIPGTDSILEYGFAQHMRERELQLLEVGKQIRNKCIKELASRAILNLIVAIDGQIDSVDLDIQNLSLAESRCIREEFKLRSYVYHFGPIIFIPEEKRGDPHRYRYSISLQLDN